MRISIRMRTTTRMRFRLNRTEHDSTQHNTTQHNKAVNDWKWLKMAGNCWKLLEWLKMAENY